MQILQGADQQTEPDGISNAVLSWQGNYVALLLELDLFERASGGRLSPRIVSGSLSGTIRLDRINRKYKILRLLEELESQQHVMERWCPSEEAFEQGFGDLCTYHVELAQHKVITLVQEYLLLEELFGRVQNRRGDTKRLIKGKQRQKSKVSTAVQHWHDWKSALAGIASTDCPAHIQQNVLRAEYPWRADTNAGTNVFSKSQLVSTVFCTRAALDFALLID